VAATRAVELAPDLAETQTSLGFVQLLDWDWKGAEASLRKAIELNPRYASSHTFLAWLLSTLDRQDEAIEEARIGKELEPFLSTTDGVAALVSYHARKYDDAIADCERALARDPTSALSLLCMSMSYAAKGAHGEAVLHAERGVQLSPEILFLRGVLGAVYAMAKRTDDARGILDDLLKRSKQTYVSPILISWIYSHLDDPDSAFAYLEKAFQEHAGTLGFGLRAPMYDGIRDDPRFGELLVRLNLS
jgi:tetratricopeptide (TPR) repeat protein